MLDQTVTFPPYQVIHVFEQLQQELLYKHAWGVVRARYCEGLHRQERCRPSQTPIAGDVDCTGLKWSGEARDIEAAVLKDAKPRMRKSVNSSS